ncbi:MAG: CAP domain-containing protein [Candidatus Aminicenantes bacterium]|nr:CAP domain-containing protein [Candidatus Aminicenantes bacterium]
MNTGRKQERLWTLFFLLSVIPLLIFPSTQTQKEVPAIPSVQAIEKELWTLINKERGLRNLPLLELSSPLSDMAGQHSLDMANQGKSEPSHLSSSGKTFVNRLENANIYFIDAGENVVFSETFVAEFIHESFFKSEGHRENILDPAFTQVGIGIVHLEHKGYYITQDFLRPLQLKTDQQVRQIVLDRVNTERHLMGLSPLDSWLEADQFSQNLAERKAKGLVLPDIPPELRETLIVFLSTPTLTQEELDFPEAVNPRFNKGTVGIWFGKNRDNPGGVYVLALMLFAENSLSSLSTEEQKEIILNLVNQIRIQSRLNMFIFDELLTEAAERMVSKVSLRKKSDKPTLPEYEHLETLSYGTEDLTRFPESLDGTVKKAHLSKIGIGVVYKKNPGSQKGTFFISLIFE